MIWSVLYRPSTSPVARQQVASLFFLLFENRRKKRAALNVPVSNSFHPNSSTPPLLSLCGLSICYCVSSSRSLDYFPPEKKEFPFSFVFYFKKEQISFFRIFLLVFYLYFSFVVAHFSLYDLHPRTICTSPPTSNKPRPPTFFGAPSAVF
jgi:hypothetical protein